VEEAIGSIEAAIANAGVDRRSGEDRARARLDRLREIAGRCDQLAESFQRAMSPPPAEVAEG
jgi:hypothetical protein